MKKLLSTMLACVVGLTGFAGVSSGDSPHIRNAAEPQRRGIVTASMKDVPESIKTPLRSSAVAATQEPTDVLGNASAKPVEAGLGFRTTFTPKSYGDYECIGIAYGMPSWGAWLVADSGRERLEKGTYVFVAIFQHPQSNDPTILVIKENVGISSDSEIVFDPAEATELITFVPVLPGGEVLVCPTLDREWNTVDGGNVFSDGFNGIFSSYLNHRYMGNLLTVEDSDFAIETADGILHTASCGNFLVSPGVSDDFCVNQRRITVSKDGSDIIVVDCSGEGMSAQTVTNKSADYVTQPTDRLFDFTGWSTEKVEEKTAVLSCYQLINGEAVTAMDFEHHLVYEAANLKTCLPAPDREVVPVSQTVPSIKSVWYLEPELLWQDPQDPNSQFWMIPTNQIFYPLLRQYDGRMEAIATPMVGGYYQSYKQFDAEGICAPLNLWGNPAFGFLMSSTAQRAGDSSPFICVDYQWNEMAGFGFVWNSVGRLGEILVNQCDPYVVAAYGDRTFSNYLSATEGEGEEMMDSWGIFRNGITDAVLDGYRGCVDITVTEEDRVRINPDLPSHAEMSMHWNFSDPMTATPPSLTMLQFRNNDGEVCDHFVNASEGTLNFSAEDIDFETEIRTSPFDTQYLYSYYTYEGYPEAKLEYSPYRTEEWDILEVSVDQDKFYKAGYGAFYTASLAGITRKAPYGWYDVKITLTDNYGNVQTSVVSPAFHIESLTGIGDSVVADNDAEVEYFDVFGRRVAAPAPGQLLIRRQGSSVSKLIVK